MHVCVCVCVYEYVCVCVRVWRYVKIAGLEEMLLYHQGMLAPAQTV